MTKYKIKIAYDGTNYFGFQIQASMPTIQGEIENALEKIYGEKIKITGAGRTDEGVHALGQVAHFVASDKISTEKMPLAINAHLQKDIRVLDCETIANDFNARKSAKRKTYYYDIAMGKGNPFLEKRAYNIPSPLDMQKMKRAAKLFVGEKDFIGFRALGSAATTTTRRIEECKIDLLSLYGSDILRITITANGFLYKMARMITAALISVGEGKMQLKEIKNILESRAERENKSVAPPYGLYLLAVEY